VDPFPRELIWDVAVDAVDLQDVTRFVDAAVEQRDGHASVFCANPHSLVVAHQDDEFLHALQSAEVVLPDGFGIVLASRLGRHKIQQRVSGPDLLEHLARHWNERTHRSFFFLGSTTEVLNGIQSRMRSEFPLVEVNGMYAPPIRSEFDDTENRRMIDAVNAADPDVLWVGMTAPKQEKWIMRHREELRVPVVCAVGAAFDFFAETKKRSPQWFRDHGLEWLPRLFREPGRLWRRNFISTPVFLYHVMKRSRIRR
jgi:N-acetylglucosaminyldiphosphoundecaprenol N-acetyl-beta-D-mannosaminyltransferase